MTKKSSEMTQGLKIISEVINDSVLVIIVSNPGKRTESWNLYSIQLQGFLRNLLIFLLQNKIWCLLQKHIYQNWNNT